MRLTFLLIAVLGGGLMATAYAMGIGPFKPDQLTCTPDGQEVLFVFDRSASATTDNATRALFAQTVASEVTSALDCAGDAVTGVLAHAATSGKAGSARYEARAASEAVAGTSADQRRIQSEYQRGVDRDRSRATQTLQFAADSTVLTPELKRQTDLLGVLRVVADSDGVVSRLVVLSDLHESMTGVGRRDFDQDPPSDAAEAQAWAAEDVAVATSTYGVDRDVLSGVTVVPVRGSFANAPSAVAVRAYWDALWTAFGAAEVSW